MIKIDVKGYCQSCTDFEPDVQRPEKLYPIGSEEVTVTDTIIRCRYRKRCETIKRYLEKQEDKDNATV